MPDSEYHVASYVVRTRPDGAAEAIAGIEQLPGMEVHAHEQGKLVVTAEAGGARELAELTGALERLEPVLSVAPVYHEFTTTDPNE
jgi:nitrate reductase NapD